MRELPTPTLDLSVLAQPALLRRPVRWPGRPAPTPTGGAGSAAGGGLSRAEATDPTRGTPPTAALGAALEVHWARHQDEVRAAQALRYRVFVEEMGARLSTPVPLHDIDLFDDYCEHLLVRDADSGEVVGTYRVLTPAQARRVGSFYADTEFDLTRLRSLRDHMVELGRSCVHPDHRHGGVIMALWGALGDFMQRNQLDTMVGCASIPMQHRSADGWVESGQAAAAIWHRLRQTHLASVEYHVRPRLPLPVERWPEVSDVEPPALIKGYLRLGAKVLGAPAWDPDFNTADLPLMLRLADMNPRYRKHFLKK